MRGVILDKLIDLKADGSFRLEPRLLQLLHRPDDDQQQVRRAVRRSRRARPEQLLTQFHMDIAASVQQVTEEIMLRMTRAVARETGERNLCLAGGVALNCVANGKILRDGQFDGIWIQPAAGDAGGSVGAALCALPPVQGAAAPPARRARRHARLLPRPAVRAARDRAAAARGGRAVQRGRRCRRDRARRPTRSPRRRRSAGSRGAWSSARARSARAPSSAIRARRRMQKTAQPEGQVPRVVPAVRAGGAARGRRATGSSSTAIRPTCCWSPACGRSAGAR